MYFATVLLVPLALAIGGTTTGARRVCPGRA